MIRVLLVDDQALVRSGFRVILESQHDIEVVGEAENGVEAVALSAELAPDVICMDVEMPQLNGIEASREILAAVASPNNTPGTPAILVLTTFGHEEYLFDALAAGVSGFLLKTSRAEQLVDAVRTLAAGGALLGPDVTRAVMQRVSERVAEQPLAQPQPQPQPQQLSSALHGDTSSRSETGSDATTGLKNIAAMDAAGLTEREREVLALVATGRSNGEIAIELFLGAATVKTHVSNLLQKLGARDRVQLVVWAHTIGAQVL